jgi:uncharacterized membrane protein (DUF485 family)
MTARRRKAFGSLLTLMFLAAYIWLATVIGGLIPSVWWAQLAVYVVVGTAWGVPLIPLISWMNRGR